MPKTRPTQFEQNLLELYLKLGSIEAVFKFKKYNLPISFAGYARLLKKYQIVTTAGPNSHLSESLYFFSLLKTYKKSLEEIYRKYLPIKINVSLNTLYRVLRLIRLGVTRRHATIILITQNGEDNKYLVGEDVSLSKNTFGQKGDWSLPTGFTREQDSDYVSILRVLQREVFTKHATENSFPWNVLNQPLKPLFAFKLVDIKVHVYHLRISRKTSKFFSFKLQNHKYLSLNEIRALKTRPGTVEILEHFETKAFSQNLTSKLNLSLQN